MLPYLELFGKHIGTYALSSIIGIFVCAFVAIKEGKKLNIAYEDIILLFVRALIGLAVGGHALYAITNLPHIIELVKKASDYEFIPFIKHLASHFGGMVFYGGLIGAIGGLYLYPGKALKNKRKNVMDLFALCIPLFHTFGRMGCFLGGCCYGIECKFGFITYNNTLIPDLNGVVRLPVQLIESACNLIIFFVLRYMYQKRKCDGELIFKYMLIYPPVRFILEFLRGDSVRGFFFYFSTSQVVSVILFAIAALYYLKKAMRRKEK